MRRVKRKSYCFFLAAICVLGFFSCASLEAKTKKKVRTPVSGQVENETHDSHFFLPSCKKQVIYSVPFTINDPGEYLVKSSLFYKNPNAAITVNANNVNIVFCEDAELQLGDGATGIDINKNNVNIINGQFNALSNQAKAVRIKNGVKKWTIDECIFRNFAVAIVSKDFEDGSILCSCFQSCNEGFVQEAGGVAHRLLIEGLRSDNKTMNNQSTESYAVSLNGAAFDSTIKNARLTASSLYCFQCSNSLIDDVEMFYPQITSPLVPGIQCGGPRGALFFTFSFENPIPEGLRKGCTNCRISNAKVYMDASSPEAFFPLGIVTLFCDNCEITNSQVTVDGGQGKFDGIGILESYCSNCTLSDCQVEGPASLGIFVCDPINQCQFCNASHVIRCSVRNCWVGLTVLRCHSAVVDSCNLQQNNVGLAISEGATNCIVKNCNIAENLHAMAYVPLTQEIIDTGIFPPGSTPDLCPKEIQDPKNGLVANTIFIGNNENIFDTIKDLNEVDNLLF